jgi:hypothetical protein
VHGTIWNREHPWPCRQAFMHGLLGEAIVSAGRAGVDEQGDLDREEAPISYSPLRFSFLWWERGGKKPVDENCTW